MTPLNVDARNFTKTPIPKASLKRVLERTLQKTKYKNDQPCAINVVFVGDARMKSLNKRWRKIDSTTDVLSFSYLGEKNFGVGDPIGEIVISLSRARAQAHKFGNTFSEEVERLLVHGLLHILGYDHEKSKKEAAKMFRLEDGILSQK